ncbi:MAG: class F420-dependent oxidoreductase [Acidimicrobiales bacterium]|nr:class F420-dependent oxidoreductase [Acidimicrobiales bacterium]
MEIGYALSCEEHGPLALVQQARLAEDAGIGSLWISDHFHPWLDEQGQSPFVWSVIGAIAMATRQRVTTAVTCPTMRVHPAVIAQAAATSAVLLEGRFELGVGSGENLNEHVLGDKWPTADERLERLEEAVELIRTLWTGEETTHHGKHYTVENARIYTRPETSPKVLMSGFGPKATDLAARLGDGYMNTSASAELLQRYRKAGGKGTADGSLKVCWGTDKGACAELAHRLWRTGGVPGELSQELRTPALFDQAAQLVTVDAIAEHMPCGPDPAPIVAAAKEFADAGFDRIFITQVGPDQAGFFAFFTRELASALRDIGVEPRASE